jgi:hypothetical protein
MLIPEQNFTRASQVIDAMQDLYALQARCKEEGICPKACAPLVQIDLSTQRCPICGFTRYTVTSYD